MSTFPVVRRNETLAKGPSAKQQRQAKQRRVRSIESKGKRDARLRDGAEYCRLFGDQCIYVGWHGVDYEGCHVDHKGIGGDHGARSTSANIIRGCNKHHRGEYSLHSKHLRVEFLTARGCNGPVRVWQREDTSTEHWFLVREERPSDVRPH